MSHLSPVHQFSSAMLRQPGKLLAWLGRRLFDHIRLDDETATRLRALPEQGQLVYIMRTRSTLDYLFFNYLFVKVGLPIARFANGMNLSIFRGMRTYSTDIWRRTLGQDPHFPPPIDQLEHTITQGFSALLFMKVRALTAERHSSPGYIERLVQLQRTMERPILLLPQLISWPRRPPSARRTWFDIAFGDQEASGRFRKLGHFIRHYKLATVQVGEPINLQQVMARHDGWTDARIARKVRRVLFIHLGREAMAIRGPKVKPAAVLRREIMERRRFQREVAEEAKRQGIPTHRAMDQARKDLREISASWTFEMLQVVGRFLDFVFNRVFQGVEVDEAGMRRIKDAAKHCRSAPLVLVPSHKSHVDYLVISWVFLNNEFVPPHVAAGANLSFFPLGTVLRRCGAFFLRRSLRGQPLYALAFRSYLWKLAREGYPIEAFVEGGRSRTGKLLPPKLGILNMLLEGVRQGEYKDLQFVPINLSYERVVETGSYRRELTGGKKRAESVGGVLRAGKVLRSRYGRIYVSFEEPVRLSEYLAQIGVEDLATQDRDAARDTTKRLAYHLMRQIQEATIVAPSALVGTVLLSHNRRGMSGARLREMVGFLIDLLSRRGARLSRSLTLALDTAKADIAEADARSQRDGFRARGDAVRPLLDEAMVLLLKLVDRVERGGDTLYTVPEKSRIELDYYRNSLLGVLAPDALIATALRATDLPLPRAQLARQVQRLSTWFRLEFIYPTHQAFDANFTDSLDRLKREGLIQEDAEGRCTAMAPRTLDFLRGTLLHLVESYWIAADALRTLAHGPLEQSDLLDHAREHGEREFLEGDIHRAEATSTALLRNALELFRREGLVQTHTTGGARKPMVVWNIGETSNLEDIAFRRDDLSAFLIRRADESTARPVVGPTTPALESEPADEQPPQPVAEAEAEPEPVAEAGAEPAAEPESAAEFDATEPAAELDAAEPKPAAKGS